MIPDVPVGSVRVSDSLIWLILVLVLNDWFKGASTTAGHADSLGDKQSLRIRKQFNRFSKSGEVYL